jgi:hypothetical protein
MSRKALLVVAAVLIGVIALVYLATLTLTGEGGGGGGSPY